MKISRESKGTASVTLYDLEPTPDRFCDDVVAGLTGHPRKLLPKYFYDEEGARLFELITQLDAYYPTRVEIEILESHGGAIAERIGPHASIVELGSGSGEKTWILLRKLQDPAAYIPVDISRAQLVDFALQVAEAFPFMQVVPVCADYTAPLPLPLLDTAAHPVAFFPGSTLGNFEPAEAELFLTRVRGLVGSEGRCLLGLDLRKSADIIEPAYDDPEGVTARFNLNLLSRINRECGGDFDLSGFRHHAFYDVEHGRVEMRLVSVRDQTVRLPRDPSDGEPVTIRFESGEFVTTEYSHKFDLAGFAATATSAGWSILDSWTDPREWFVILLLG